MYTITHPKRIRTLLKATTSAGQTHHYRIVEYNLQMGTYHETEVHSSLTHMRMETDHRFEFEDPYMSLGWSSVTPDTFVEALIEFEQVRIKKGYGGDYLLPNF